MTDSSNTVPRVPKRVAAVILNSLKGGVVPRIGLPYITVGRETEIRALLTDLSLIADGGASFRFLVGRYGAGKSFLLQTIRTHAMGEGFVVADADLSPERRLQGGQGQGLATYRELIRNLSTKTRPEGGALNLILDRWVASTLDIRAGEGDDAESCMRAQLDELEEMVHGFDYGQTKAAGDIAVAGCPSHYIMRSSWVIGEGHNFVKTMKALSDRVADPEDKLDKITVVDDQLGRLTFTRDMAAAIFHVLDTHAAYGTYDCTGSGAAKSWAEIARAVFDAANGNVDKVVPVSTADYYASAEGPIAPRPVHSALDLSKLEETGFHMPDWEEELEEYLKAL